MADENDKIWVWSGYGEGYFVSKEEYKQHYEGAKQFQEKEPNKESQILQNKMNVKIKQISDDLAYAQHHDNDLDFAKSSISECLKEVRTYLKQNPYDNKIKDIENRLLKLQRTARKYR